MRLCGKLNFKPCSLRGMQVAKEISFDAAVPLLAVPLFMLIAAQSFAHTLVVFSLTPLVIYYLYRNFLRFQARTKFFFYWTVTSIVILLLVFEIFVVPLLEILPEENLIFVIFVVAALITAYMTRLRAEQVKDKETIVNDSELGKEEQNICKLCNKYASPKTHHCRLCQMCIPGQEYHCKWLDCCISKNNIRWYIPCLFFTTIALIYGSNLTTTTICHPFIFIGMILLPYDCSDVYFELDTAISFVSAVYSLVIGFVLMAYLIYRLWLISAKKIFTHNFAPDRELQNSDGSTLKRMKDLFRSL